MSRKRPSAMQNPNFNGDESDSVATGEVEVAAARIRAAMKGAKPKGSAAHIASDVYNPHTEKSSVGGSMTSKLTD